MKPAWRPTGPHRVTFPALVDKTEDLYARRPDSVRRTIISGSMTGLTAFVDAFRLRKD